MSAREATFELTVDSPQLAERVARALAVETHDAPPRTRTFVEAAGATLRIRIEAEDTRGLRAATNSFLRWADAAIDAARQVSESFKRTP